MKKLIALTLLLISVASCSLDDNDAVSYGYEILPVESVDMPAEFTLGETYTITVSYYRPSTCHYFSEFYYVIDENQRTVAPITVVYNDNNCQDLENTLVDSTFDFLVTSKNTYVFKYWQGEDEDGDDVYLTIEVPVVEN
ncbi:MAG: hypothetical protein ACK5NB_08245 [Flavobacteriaceae bacterium]